jgi:hypothetical protein
MTDKQRGRGAPTKYKDEYCDLIVSMAKEGASFTEFRAAIGGVTRQTLHNWKEAHDDFLDAYTRAEVEGEAYWERQMRKDLMYNKEVNSPLVKLYFANRFGWSDKTETKNDHTSSDGSMTPSKIELVVATNDNKED